MIKDIFKTSAYINDLNCDLKQLRDFALWLEKNEVGSEISNLSGYQSQNLAKSLDVIKPLIEKLNKSVETYCDVLKIKGGLKLSNIWVNINRFKDSNRMHRHPGSVISGVFYVKTPNDCGDIWFETMNIMEDYWKPGDNIKYNEYNSPSWLIPPKENHCILFPSWLAHMVKPNFNKTEERISFSFNYNYDGI